MCDMLTCIETLKDTTQTSAFQKVRKNNRNLMSQWCCVKKRDSGYGSDCSPSSFNSSSSRKLTADDNEIYLEILDDLKDINDDNIFMDTFDVTFNVTTECAEDEEIDREVEHFITNTQDRPVQLSDTSRPQRPSAPIPNCRNVVKLPINSYDDMHLKPIPSNHICQKSRTKHIRRYIISSENCSVGTQTSGVECQLMKNDLSSSGVFESWPQFATGETTLMHHRTQSKSHNFSLLPDIVLSSLDKHISLNDVQSFHQWEQEQHVGRELRRISDDFQSSYLRSARLNVKRRNLTERQRLFPFTFGIDFYSYWKTFRRVLSNSQSFHPSWNEEESER